MALAAFTQVALSGNPLALAGVVMVLAAFYLKAAVAPFHVWAPDAYEVSTIPVTAHMAVLIKAGVLMAALRIFGDAAITPMLTGLLIVPPLISIVWGNLAAMRQTSFRRMIAYSSIAHAGYLFYAFLGEGSGRFSAILFYLMTYGVMNLVAFAAIPPCDDDARRDNLDHLKGLYHRSPFAAIVMALAMFSLAGLPPFPGFIAKFMIFRNVFEAGHVWVAILGLLGSYLGLYFYFRVVQFMFMSPSTELAEPKPLRRAAVVAVLLCLAGALILTLFPGTFFVR